MSKIIDTFRTTDPKDLVGKLDPERLQGIDLRDGANILIVDTVGRYVKDPDKLLVTIKKVEDKLGVSTSGFMDSPIGEMISAGRSMVAKGLDALKESGIIGPDGKLDLDGLLDTAGNFLNDIGGGILDTLKSGLDSLKNLGDALGITELIDTAKGWFNNIVDFVDALIPDFVKDIFSNLDFGAIFPDADDSVLDRLQPTMDKIVDTLGIDWLWFDKSRSLYNYDVLANVNELTIRLISGTTSTTKGMTDESREELQCIAANIRKHYYTSERLYRTMRRT